MLPSIVTNAWNQVARRNRQVSRILKTEGISGITERARLVAVHKLKPRHMDREVANADVLGADLASPFLPPPYQAKPGEPISVNFVITPAAAGSGGHTTIFRMVKYMMREGFKITVYFYDVYGADHKYYADIVRKDYGVQCEMRDLKQGMDDADAVVATSWPTAYAVYNCRSAGKRFYFVQDYEPHFYSVGANYLLAENTYRMGFHGITAGRWLAEKLSSDFGMEADYFPFGCDSSIYRRDNEGPRNGVAFYARASTPRRGVEIGLLALEVFAQNNPQIDIHLYGGNFSGLPFRFINHGLVTPAQLNDIYNNCFAGLSLSLTNVSLVPQEMLAAGCIPVVNDAEHNRIVLDNPYVCYAPATPHALAAAMESVVKASDFQSLSREAAASMTSGSWDQAGAVVANVIRRSRTSHPKQVG
ncbi:MULTISPECIES: glycosyltransferase family 1 protein [Mesorhizobium]|uniref:Glycosyltransferase family 1 protein n=1 Tax=Mesorhizobium denitrificans TaxID=2294114 RepID=A0A371X213_9HYPH|nr:MULTISPECIES: glycosyltransferase family 1 protein [Mesorhizobium]RFC63266.1 glycosyltransferase family 1 protein [Mesorhizobium denitrificans]